MTYDEILQLTAEAVGEQLTERELDALAQAITCAEHGMLKATAATGAIAWLDIAGRISREKSDALADIVRKQMGWNEEDESDESVRAN